LLGEWIAPTTKLFDQRPMFARTVYLGLGFALLAIGAVGVVVPLLPTTPFVLLAAACFVRSSPRWNEWLHRSPLFGQALHDWNTHRRVSRATIVKAVLLCVVGAGLSIALPRILGVGE